MTDVLPVDERPPRILIADDDPSIVQFLAERCERIGLDVRTAKNGLAALAIAARNPPDLLIVDVNMPELDGLSLCLHLLAPERKGLDVVVITGNQQPETIERCDAVGAIYARKGPEFWTTVEAALVESFPHLAARIAQLQGSWRRVEVSERPRVLVVDDDVDVGQFLCSRLRKYGLDALVAHNAIAAYRLAQSHKPVVIISDYYMPDGDALNLLWKLRSSQATQTIPVFVMSGRRLDEPTETNLRRDFGGWPGAVRLFKKPLDFEQLAGALQTFCGLQSVGGAKRGARTS